MFVTCFLRPQSHPLSAYNSHRYEPPRLWGGESNAKKLFFFFKLSEFFRQKLFFCRCFYSIFEIISKQSKTLPTTIRSEKDLVVNGPEQYRSLSAKLALPPLDTCSRSPEHRSDCK